MTEKLVVIVEMASDATFDCYLEDETKDFGAAGYGNTAKEAIEDFRKAEKEMRAIHEEEGTHIPPYNYEFRYDIRSFFDKFDFFNIKRISEMAGINYTQMIQYLNGNRKASELQYRRLRKCFGKISEEMEKATF